MKWKKVQSMALAFFIAAGTMGQAAPSVVKAEEANIVSGYQDPWNNHTIPKLLPKTDPDVEKKKFTHQEWTGNDYTDVEGNAVKGADVYGINREEASVFASTGVVYDTVEKAIEGAKDYNKEASEYVQFLTGTGVDKEDWSLVVLQNQTQAQADSYKAFYQTEYMVNAKDNWKENLTLPCSWTRQGFDFSIYTNVQMPWQSKYDAEVSVPYAPVNYNPVGLYRKPFTVDQGLWNAGGRIYLSFQGVESAYYVYVNGKEVGYSEDSYSPHSFDVTDYLNKSGENLLAVKVHKFCDGTWMEDQDMFYDGGIFRDVYLYSAPLVHIQDYTVVTDLDENYTNADMKLKVTVANASAETVSGYNVDVRLYDEKNQMFVNGMTMNIGKIGAASEGADGKASVELSKKVLAPKLWSAETPNLYTLVLSLYNDVGAYLGSVSQQLGFREIAFTSTQVDEWGNRTTADEAYIPIQINGKKLLLKGTNRHDTDPVYGKYVPKETQEEDVKLMKQYNLNAIRTSHYSNDEYLYYLCDKYGLYMMGETNLESHAIMNWGDGQKNFKKLAMDRTITAFQRLKNCTALIAWSTGNENYYSGDASYADYMFYDLIQYFKQNDPTRPVHSESSGEKNGTDMGSNMYPSLDVVQGWTQWKQPYVLCEYDHAMGNAVGNLKEYWDIIRSSDNMLGGFIWDWVDQSRLLALPESKEGVYDYYAEEFAYKNLYQEEAKGNYYCYGGDSGESPNDNSFCVNGLVSPDRDVQPELYEVKYQYQNVWFTATEEELNAGTVQVYNENNFLNLNQFAVTWSLQEDGKEIGSGTVEQINLPGRTRGKITVPYIYAMADTKAGAEYYLNLSVALKEDTLWAKAGHEVAYEQFKIPANVKKVFKPYGGKVTVNQEDTKAITVSGADFSFQLDRRTGAIREYTWKGEVILEEGPLPNYWRALTNNDVNESGFDKNWADVKTTDAYEISVAQEKEDEAIITVSLNSNRSHLWQQMVYTIDGTGAVTVKTTVNAKDTGLGGFVRIGTVMKLPEGYEQVAWYGNGPVEAVWDREDFARVGRYETTVSELFYPYLDTQDTGTITGVHCFSITDPGKAGAMAIASADGVEASALHFDVWDLDQARHPYELTKLDETILTVNYRSAGTGNASCGPHLLDNYRLPSDQIYSYEYTMVPYSVENTDIMDVTRPYRTETYASLAQMTADIDAIGSDTITGADAERFQDLADAYETLSEEEKAQVSEARFDKVAEALMLARKLQETTVCNDEKRGLSLPLSDTAKLVRRADGAAFEGHANVTGNGADEKFHRLFSGTNSFTIETVVNPNGFGYGGDFNMFASKGDNCSAFRISEQSLYFFVKDMEDGEWHTVKIGLTDAQMKEKLHVAAIYDGVKGTIALYLEGREALEVTGGIHGVTASSYPLQIGYCQETGRMSKASIYSMRIYSRALSKEELDQGNVPEDDEAVAVSFGFDQFISSELTGLRSYTPPQDLAKGERIQIKVEKVPFYAAKEPAITFTSGDTSVVIVDENTGMAEAVGAGEAVITARCGKTSLEIPVTVEKSSIKYITGISVEEKSVILDETDTYQIRPVITPTDATEKVIYASLEPAIVSVTADGLVTAIAKGESDITVTAASNSAIVQTIHITVNEKQADDKKPITAITIRKDTVTLNAGSAYTIEAEVTPSDTTENVRYTSVDPRIASVDTAGVITAKAEGKTDIILESPSNAEINAVIHVTVTAKPVADNPGDDQNPGDNQKPGDSQNPTGNQTPGTSTGTNTLPKKGAKFRSGILEYKVTKSSAKNGAVSVIRLLNKKKSKITIPATVKKNGYSFRVTAVNKQVFQKNRKITDVVIGKNVGSIGAKSFYGCQKLKSVRFMGVKAPKIGSKAFSGIRKNCKITVPKKMTKKNLSKLKKAMKRAGNKVSYKKK